MKRITKTAGALGLVGFAVMCGPLALADDVQDSYWYLGGNVGQSRATIDDARITSDLAASSLTTTSMNDDNKHLAYKLFGGYQMNKNFAVEAGYLDLGQFGYTATTSPAGTRNGNIKLKGLNLDLLGILPLNEQYSLFGRVGMNYAQAKDEFSSTGAVPPPAAASPNKNSVNYKLGVGVQYDFAKAFGLRAEAERYRVNDAIGNTGDVNFLSIGLVYRFDEKKPAPVQQAAAPIVEDEPILVIVPVIKMQQYCSILDVQFEIKNDEIQREDREKLSVVGTFMNKYPDTTAVIEGYTDNVGTPEFNMKLSQRRAQNVVSYLMDNFHISSTRLTAVGYGETRPIADNSTKEGQQMNRRVNAVIACARDIAGLKVAPARVTMAMQMDFDPYKSNIEPQYFAELKDVADFMRANPKVTATVEGHASKMVGNVHVSAQKSMEISNLRAQKVVDYLVDKEGISRSRLSAEAFGRTRRVAYGTSLEGQTENRRLNIIFNYPK